ncbi:MAG TPA: IncP-type conjugal transfer protein TraG, partial [Polyangiaceae bacterium]|nr:IncP-type conjugal transfer protein TraG [Polyangiaceae bacterium]
MRLFAVAGLLLLTFAGFCLSTQYVAAQLHYGAELGSPWLVLGTLRLYAPWQWLVWDHAFGAHAPLVFRTASGLTTLSSLLGCAVAIAAALKRKPTGTSNAHGSSRWATTAEIRAAGLLRNAGVVLCQTSDARFRTTVDAGGQVKTKATRLGALVRHDGPEHVFCFAPTRSGKGVGLVIPTLLSWPHSALVYDIKRENWSLTAGWRRQFSRVWRFEPTAADSVRFNPLLEIRRGLSEVKDTQNVADILVDPTGEKESRDHWQTTAHSLLCGAILHTLYAEVDKTLAGVANLLSDPARAQADTFQRMLCTSHLPEGPHPVVSQVAREMLNKSDNELSGVVSTAVSCLGLYRDPLVARNTGASDFRIADLISADVPVSLYLVVPPSDLTRTRPVIRLLLNQIGRRLTESLQVGGQGAYKHRLLFLLDEFPSLGRLDFFETALAFMAGYGLKAFLIAQSLNQLEKAYGPNNSILDNCHIRMTYAANDDRTARRISDLLGQGTVKKLHRSYSGSGLFLQNRTESEQEYARPLLTPAEVNQLPPDDGILFVGGSLPYRARKVRYFLDPRFRGRDKLPPPDRPEEQARELCGKVASDWEGLLAAPAVAPAPSQPPGGEPPSEREVVVDEGRPTNRSTGSGADLWSDFFSRLDEGPPERAEDKKK